jgi:tetratricopeptide (TPR) repeat protein
VDVIERATEHDPSRRFKSAAAMETALAAQLTESTVGGRDSVQLRRSFGYRLAATITAVLVVSGAVSAAVWRFGPDSLIERQRQSTPVIPAAARADVGTATPEIRAADGKPNSDTDAGPSEEAAAPQVRLNAGDWILVADIDNRTGEEVLDGTIEVAVKRELEYSEFVRVAQRDRVEDALLALGQPLDSHLDRGLARKVALRDGSLRADLAGSVDKTPGAYVITLDVITPGDNRTVMSVTEKVTTQQHILAAVRKQVLAIRQALGEPLASVDRSRTLLASTQLPSIEALSLYTRAAKALDVRRPIKMDWLAVERLARRAVENDPMFARAALMLAYALGNQDRPQEEYLPYAERAFRLADTATPQERYFIIGSLHQMKSGGRRPAPTPQAREELEQAVAAYEALFALQPDHYDLLNNLRLAYNALGRDRDLAWMALRVAEARPLSVTENLGVARRLLGDGNLDGARRYAARAELALPRGSAAAPPTQAALARLFSAYIAWLQDDPREALRIADRVLSTAGEFDIVNRRELYLRLWALYAVLGRLRQAEHTIEALRGTDGVDLDSRYQSDLAQAQFLSVTEQLVRLRELMATQAREPLASGTHPRFAARIDYLIEGGLLELAERDLEWFKQRSPGSTQIYDSLRAALERALGHPDAAIAGFQKVNQKGQNAASAFASALESVGRFSEAIDEIERAGTDRADIVSGNTLGLWLHGRAQLARLYRKNGQNDRAREVEAHLLKLLAMADADHPLVQELRARH